MANKLSKLKKIAESISVNRYDNGYMVEVQGRDSDGDWKTAKVICTTEDELISLIKEANTIELDN